MKAVWAKGKLPLQGTMYRVFNISLRDTERGPRYWHNVRFQRNLAL
jgi:hypothetical protein